jgi:hypothetical protein
MNSTGKRGRLQSSVRVCCIPHSRVDRTEVKRGSLPVTPEPPQIVVEFPQFMAQLWRLVRDEAGDKCSGGNRWLIRLQRGKAKRKFRLTHHLNTWAKLHAKHYHPNF